MLSLEPINFKLPKGRDSPSYGETPVEVERGDGDPEGGIVKGLGLCGGTEGYPEGAHTLNSLPESLGCAGISPGDPGHIFCCSLYTSLELSTLIQSTIY
jgi:hypothetical protein